MFPARESMEKSTIFKGGKNAGCRDNGFGGAIILGTVLEMGCRLMNGGIWICRGLHYLNAWVLQTITVFMSLMPVFQNTPWIDGSESLLSGAIP